MAPRNPFRTAPEARIPHGPEARIPHGIRPKGAKISRLATCDSLSVQAQKAVQVITDLDRVLQM